MLRRALPLALLLLLGTRARADAPASIGLQIQVIAASATKGAPDPRLARLQKRLEGFPFQSFKLLAEQEMLLGLKAQGKMLLPEGRTLEVQPEKFEDGGKLLLSLHLKNKTDVQLVSADAAIAPGSDFTVALSTKDQGTILVYIRHSRTSVP